MAQRVDPSPVPAAPSASESAVLAWTATSLQRSTSSLRVQPGFTALLLKLLAQVSLLLRGQLPGQIRLFQRLALVLSPAPTRCPQGRPQLRTALLRRILASGSFPTDRRLRPCAPGDNRSEQEKPKMLHSANITPNPMPLLPCHLYTSPRAGNICNSMSTLSRNSAIQTFKPAKSALLQIQWCPHEPSPQPQ